MAGEYGQKRESNSRADSAEIKRIWWAAARTEVYLDPMTLVVQVGFATDAAVEESHFQLYGTHCVGIASVIGTDTDLPAIEAEIRETAPWSSVVIER